MKIKKRFIRKVISVFASLLLLVNSLTPYLLIVPTFRSVSAQEEITPTAEPTLVPTETAVPSPTVEITPTAEVSPVETISATEVPTLTPIEAPSVPSPPVEENLIINSEESAKLAIPLWQINPDGSATTTEVVSLNQTYKAPQNDKVTVTFTKLRDNSGKLTIKEVKLTAEQQAEIGAFSDTAYDITSDMTNGNFTYDLTLPLPESAKGKDIEVKSGETVDEVTTNAEFVDEPKEVKSETITITGLDHFTVFIVVNPATGSDGSGVGTISWSSLSSIYSANGVFATSSPGANATTHYLKGTNYGLSIPSTANIEGILVKVKRKAATANRIKDNSIKIIKGGTVKTVNKANTSTFWPTTNSYASYGGAADLWGETWTPADVNASNFGVAVSAVRSSTGATVVASVDHIQVTVYYNNPPTISISSPNGGEVYAGGSIQNITWAASDDDLDTLTIDLEYSIDGVVFTPITSGLTNFGAYSWTVPSLDSESVTVKAIVSDGTIPVSDVSDAVFTIDSTAPSLFNQTTFSGWYTSDQTSDFTYADDNGIASGTPVSCVISTEGTNQTCIADPVNVCDNAGNCNTSTVTSYGADIDKSTPTDSGTPTADFSSPTNQTFITWSWTAATDVISDVKHYLWNLYQDVDTWLDGSNTTDIQLSADVSGYGDGDFSFDVQPEDNAGNTGNTLSSPITTVDNTLPELTQAYTRDIDGNGYLDAIELFFSENINDDMLNPETADGWDVEGADGESIGTGDTPDDNILLLNFSEGPTPDSGNTPNVIYTASGGPVSTHDVAGNELASGSFTTSDGAVPALLSAVTKDSDVNGQIDAVKLTFSENINDSMLDISTNDNWDVENYDGEIIGTGSVDNDDILLLSFNESGSLDTGVTPSVYYTSSFEKFSTHDTAGNQLKTGYWILSDGASPTIPTASPVAGDYTSDKLVTLESTDTGGSDPVTIYYTVDNSDPDDTKTLYSSQIPVDHDMTIKAIAYDSAGNQSGVLTATYRVAPQISSEASTFIGTTSTTITWTTDDSSTSRVVYDTVSHSLGAGENYGYANSTVEDSTKVTLHSVGLTGLTAGTTYYYRTISHGSPEAVGDEKTFATTSTSTTSDGGTVAGASTSNAVAPVCNDTKPGNAPVLLSAVAGINSVTLIWSKASDPVSYYLMTFGTSPRAQTYGNPNVGNQDTTSYTVSGLSGGVTYYFKVRAGNGCMPGDFSNELSSIPGGGFVEGIPAGFEAGVLGEATKSAELNEEGLTPTTTVINVGMVKGIQTIAKNKFFKYILWAILILLLIFVIYRIYIKRKNDSSD